MGRTSYENYLPHDLFLPVIFLPAVFCQLGHPMSMAVHNATLGSILEYSISHPQPLPTNYTTPCSTQQFNNFTSNKSPKHPGPYLISPRFNQQESQQPTPKNKVLTFQPHEQQPPFPVPIWTNPDFFPRKLTSANTSSPPSNHLFPSGPQSRGPDDSQPTSRVTETATAINPCSSQHITGRDGASCIVLLP